MRLTALPQQFQKYLSVHDDLAGGSEHRCIVRGRETVFGLVGAVQQIGNVGFQGGCNAFDIIQSDIVFRALDSTDIAAV